MTGDNMHVVFRVDSSQIIGSGHLMRCLTLAGEMKAHGFEVCFVCRDLIGNISYIIESHGYKTFMLPRVEYDKSLTGYASWLTVSQERDAKETADIISSYGNVDLVVVDSYAIDNIWEQFIRPYTGKIFVIDDLANRTHDCDFLLDQTYGAEKSNRYNGLIPVVCQRFLGVAYALLRPVFYSMRKKTTVREKVKNVFVFFGGSDDTGETQKVLQALRQEDFSKYHFYVLIGSMNKEREIIERECKTLGNVDFHCQVDNIEEYIAQSDVALAAPGCNTWERCMLGLPSIMTVTADNQREIAKQIEQMGAALSIGWHENVFSADYVHILERLEHLPVQEMSRKAFAIMGDSKLDEVMKVIGA